MGPMSRRTVLRLGVVGAAAVGAGAGIGGVMLLRDDPQDLFRPRTADVLIEPPALQSRSGELAVTLEAASGPHRVAGRDARTLGYNGGVPGPTLVVRPGDRLRVRLVNRLDEVTNLHVHGLHVSPTGNADNVFLEIPPGESFDYEYALPPDHPAGVYWYHPHHHGMVADQLFGGLYGAILVQDPTPLGVAVERLLLVSDLSLDAAGRLIGPTPRERMHGREGDLVLVNGQVVPRIESRAGSRERWRIVNACSSRFLSLRLDGHALHLLGMDGGRFADPVPTEGLLLSPGNRADVLVTVGAAGGILRAVPYDRGAAGMGPPGRGGDLNGDGPLRLADLVVTGTASREHDPLPTFPEPRDLRTEPVDRRRELVLAMGPGMGMGMGFTIDGRAYQSERVDQRVHLGTVEEWTIRNDSPMDHPFHLHVWPMQVVGGDAGDPTRATWQDVVNVPARGRVRVRVAFEDFPGRTVYHCHILDHEDLGMMGVIEVASADS